MRKALILQKKGFQTGAKKVTSFRQMALVTCLPRKPDTERGHPKES